MWNIRLDPSQFEFNLSLALTQLRVSWVLNWWNVFQTLVLLSEETVLREAWHGYRRCRNYAAVKIWIRVDSRLLRFWFMISTSTPLVKCLLYSWRFELLRGITSVQLDPSSRSTFLSDFSNIWLRYFFKMSNCQVWCMQGCAKVLWTIFVSCYEKYLWKKPKNC